MKLTDVDRLILANQYEILGKLDNNPSYIELSENLRNGFAYFYDQALDNLQPVLDDDTQEFVFEVLGMYQEFIWYTSDADGVSTISSSDIRFHGFDNNQEAIYLRFVNAVRNAGMYEEVLGKRSLNSSLPMVELYRRRLNVRRKFGVIGSLPRPLTEEQILEIIRA